MSLVHDALRKVEQKEVSFPVDTFKHFNQTLERIQEEDIAGFYKKQKKNKQTLNLFVYVFMFLFLLSIVIAGSVFYFKYLNSNKIIESVPNVQNIIRSTLNVGGYNVSNIPSIDEAFPDLVSELNCSGIFCDDSGAYVIINDRILRSGDTINKVQVLHIDSKLVILKYLRKVFYITTN